MEAAMKEIRLPKSIKPVQYLPFLTFSLFLHWFIVTFFTTRRSTLIMPDSPERLTLIWTLRKKPTLWCWMPRNYVLLYFCSLLTPSFVPTACIVLKVSSEWQRDWHSWVFVMSLFFWYIGVELVSLRTMRDSSSCWTLLSSLERPNWRFSSLAFSMITWKVSTEVATCTMERSTTCRRPSLSPPPPDWPSPAGMNPSWNLHSMYSMFTNHEDEGTRSSLILLLTV